MDARSIEYISACLAKREIDTLGKLEELRVDSERQEPVVELEHVNIQFGNRIIMNDVNMTVNEGEFIAILGPNGAGKSTLLKLLLGLIKPSEGIVRVLGRPPRRGNSDIG